MITTKVGDRGMTNLMGKTVEKTSCAIKTLGSLDVLAASLGLARTKISGGSEKIMIPQIQVDLLQACTDIGKMAIEPKGSPKAWNVEQEQWRVRISFLEGVIKDEEKQEYFKGFYLYGPRGYEISATFDMSRALCRQTEVVLWEAYDSGEILSDEIIVYINRLSDYLWLMARKYGDLRDTVENFKEK